MFHCEVHMVFWGEMSPQLLQRITKGVKTDVENASKGILDMTLIDTLCSLGTDGEYDNNMNRDLMTRLETPDLPEPHVFSCPVNNPLKAECCSRNLKMLFPHEMFSALFHHYKEAFFTFIIPSLDTLAAFWDAMKGESFLYI